MSDADAKAWGDFWAEQQARGSGGCLPEGWRGIEDVQTQAWATFARTLPTPCELLDLATGDGRVMGWLLEHHTKLTAIGVDLAPQLPPPPSGTTVKANVSMEDLPFDDASFDAVVSQFGFEYGAIEQVAAEIARVLKPKGKVGLLTHRFDGPILAHNTGRRQLFGWIFERKDLFNVAKDGLQYRSDERPYVPAGVTQAVQEARQRFGGQSVAWEISEAVRRALLVGPTVSSEQIAATLDTIADRAQNEIGRINSLESACRVTQDSESFEKALQSAGLSTQSVMPLSETAEAVPFADFRVIARGA